VWLFCFYTDIKLRLNAGMKTKTNGDKKLDFNHAYLRFV